MAREISLARATRTADGRQRRHSLADAPPLRVLRARRHAVSKHGTKLAIVYLMVFLVAASVMMACSPGSIRRYRDTIDSKSDHDAVDSRVWR